MTRSPKLNRTERNRTLAGIMSTKLFHLLFAFSLLSLPIAPGNWCGAAERERPRNSQNTSTSETTSQPDSDLEQYGIYHESAPQPERTWPVTTSLPLLLQDGDRITFIGNTLLERSQYFGHFETLLHQRYPKHKLVIRNLAWPADTPDLKPRPANFADLDQHMVHEKTDVIFAAFGFNESFAGEEGIPEFRLALSKYIADLRSKAFNGRSGPRIVLISPIANENVENVPAADMNNGRIQTYARVMQVVAAEQEVGFVDLFAVTRDAMTPSESRLTFNGIHLNQDGYALIGKTLYEGLFDETPPSVDERVRNAVVEKNRQYFSRYRPANTFYYTGNRNKRYGYLDFLPAMRNFDIMVANRDQRIWDLAQGTEVPNEIDDSNVPPLPKTAESRSANRWISAQEELSEFKIDPRFEVNLFAGEEEFPDIAAPIQIRWDTRGRLWVSCSTTYPHVYPGNEPNDKLVILEDTDGDGKADKSSVFADDLHIPLSFEFGDGGVYVSEMPHLTFLKDTDGDGKADFRRKVLTGFGTEDSHHSLHDFVWTPDGDLMIRESIFLHTQIETPYGPVRQANSGWFRFEPRKHRLTAFGSYPNTNPWGVTFDDWGQHVASHPVFASAFHALNPPFPEQHPRASGLRAYSGTCGQEFVDFETFPNELQGHYIKVRYKPVNRVEIHKWNENAFGFDEEYVGDLIFSRNLSFIPVDIRFGPRGALYVCDWYNPIKGHAQYSLRDERRDRHSGRIWRITTKGKELQDPPQIADAPIDSLLDALKRREYRYRYWAKRELRERDPAEVKQKLDNWVRTLDSNDPRFRHHQVEAIWTYRTIDAVDTDLLRKVIQCKEHHARAAATRQLRYWHADLPDAISLLRASANDSNGLVRMEAAIAASYLGTKDALDAMLDVAKHPREKHLSYAFTCALGSESLRQYWKDDPHYAYVPALLKESERTREFKETTRSASQAQFDTQRNLVTINISTVPERMKFSVEEFTVKAGQPVKLVFTNPDATDHNLLIVRPGALEEVGTTANAMARDPANANSNFIPSNKKHLILQNTPMIGPTRKAKVHVLRFIAPKEPDIYPYVCTFPGHWVVMNGEMLVVNEATNKDALLASRETPTFVRDWKLNDLAEEANQLAERSITQGKKAFMRARCDQCHAVSDQGVALGPDLSGIAEKYTGSRLLQEILLPSTEISDQYRTWRIVKKDGDVLTGTIVKESVTELHLIPNLLAPDNVVKVLKKQIAGQTSSKLSPMPEGLLVTLQKDEILDLLAFLQNGATQIQNR